MSAGPTALIPLAGNTLRARCLFVLWRVLQNQAIEARRVRFALAHRRLLLEEHAPDIGLELVFVRLCVHMAIIIQGHWEQEADQALSRYLREL